MVMSPLSCNLAFQFAGLGMMMIISLLCYRATVHPLKPTVSGRKLKVVCGLVYLFGLIVGCGTQLPPCFIKSTVVLDAYWKFYYTFAMFFGIFGPTVFMAVVYYKISRSLMKQNKYTKRVCSNAMQSFLVCLSTVLCYEVACIPMSVWFMWDIVAEYNLQIRIK